MGHGSARQWKCPAVLHSARQYMALPELEVQGSANKCIKVYVGSCTSVNRSSEVQGSVLNDSARVRKCRATFDSATHAQFRR